MIFLILDFITFQYISDHFDALDRFSTKFCFFCPPPTMIPHQKIAHATAKQKNKQSTMLPHLPPPPPSPQLPTYKIDPPNHCHCPHNYLECCCHHSHHHNRHCQHCCHWWSTPTTTPSNKPPFSLSHNSNHKKVHLTLNNEGNIQMNFPWTNSDAAIWHSIKIMFEPSQTVQQWQTKEIQGWFLCYQTAPKDSI